MEMSANDKIIDLLEPAVTALGYEWVGIVYRPSPKHGLLRIYIDTPEGVTVDDCARVSQLVSEILDVEDPIAGEYSLEISSPGLDRPLFKLSDYERFIGSEVRISLHGVWEGRRKISGTILGVNTLDNTIHIQENEEKRFVPLTQINKANIKAEV